MTGENKCSGGALYFQSGCIVSIYNSSLSAHHGGAVYVGDHTNSGTCASSSHKIHSTLTECSFQVLSLSNTGDSLQLHNVIHFEDNFAHHGSTIYGELLGRCTINRLNVVYIVNKQDLINGFTHFESISIQLITQAQLFLMLLRFTFVEKVNPTMVFVFS